MIILHLFSGHLSISIYVHPVLPGDGNLVHLEMVLKYT